MLKQITQLPGSKLVDLENGDTIGEILNWIIDPDNKKISALVVKEAGLLRPAKVISTIDVIEYGPSIVVVRNQGAIVNLQEVVRLKKLNKYKNKVLGGKIITASGKNLGVAEDLLFETMDSSIQKIYIKSPLINILNKPDIIISADKIIEIKPGEITVQDDAGEIQSSKLVDASSS